VENIAGRRTFAIVLVVILIASIALGSYAVYTEIDRSTYETEWSYSNEASTTYGIIRSDPEGNIIALESNQYPLDGRHTNYYIALDPNGTPLWRFPLNAEFGLTAGPIIGPDGGYYYVDFQEGSMISQVVSRCNMTVLNHDGTIRWNYIADSGDVEILDISDQGGVMAQRHEQYLNETTNETEWSRTVLSLSAQGELLWEVEIPYADTFIYRAQYSENGTIELFAAMAESDWLYLIGMGEQGDVLYKVTTSPWFPDYEWTKWAAQDSDNYYMVWRTTTAPHTEVVKVSANNLTDGSLRWETVIWEDKGSDEAYPPEHSGGRAAFIDSDGIIYASDEDGELFALDRNGSVLWTRDSMEVVYGCFPWGGLLIGDRDSFQRIDGKGDMVWSIEGLELTVAHTWTIITPDNDTMVLVHDGAITEVTVNSEPQFTSTAAIYLVLTLLVVAVLVTILYLVIRKDKGHE
jgi:hypothetical protein